MHFGFMSEKRTHLEKATRIELCYMKTVACFIDLEKAFDRILMECVEIGDEEERNTRSFG